MKLILLTLLLPLASALGGDVSPSAATAPAPASEWAQLERLVGQPVSAPEVRAVVEKFRLRPIAPDSQFLTRVAEPHFRPVGIGFDRGKANRVFQVSVALAPSGGGEDFYTGDLPFGIRRGDTLQDVVLRLGPPDMQADVSHMGYWDSGLNLNFDPSQGLFLMKIRPRDLDGWIRQQGNPRLTPDDEAMRAALNMRGYSEAILISDQPGEAEVHTGELPHGLQRTDDVAAVVARLGKPDRVIEDGGHHTLYYRDLRLRVDFNPKGKALWLVSTMSDKPEKTKMKITARAVPK